MRERGDMPVCRWSAASSAAAATAAGHAPSSPLHEPRSSADQTTRRERIAGIARGPVSPISSTVGARHSGAGYNWNRRAAKSYLTVVRDTVGSPRSSYSRNYRDFRQLGTRVSQHISSHILKRFYWQKSLSAQNFDKFLAVSQAWEFSRLKAI